MTNEKQLQKEIVDYLRKNYWEVKEYVSRKDCLTWEHPYQADLIIRHPSYKKLGWIGIEIKDHHKVADAFQQIITKYQSHYFDSIDQPINIWGIIVNTEAGLTPQDNYSFARGEEQKRYLQKFGIGILNWKGWKEAIIFNHSNTAKCGIWLDPLKRNETDEDLLISFVLDKCQWIKSINKNNTGFIEYKKFNEVIIDAKKSLFEFA